MNKNSPVIYFFFFMSIFLALSCNNWFSMWMAIELNTLIFLTFFIKNKKLKLESAITYFLIQSSSSIFMMLSFISSEMWLMNMNSPSIMLMVSIFLKLGLAPFHMWFIPMCFSTNDKTTFWLLITMQKIIPLMLLLHMTNNMEPILWVCASLSIFLSSFLNMKQISFKMMLIILSMSSMGWLMMALMNNSILMFYLFFYFVTTLLLMNSLNISLKKNSTKTNFKIIIIYLFMLASLPPLMGFYPKLMIMMCVLDKMFILLLMFFLLMSAVDVFIISRLSLILMMKTNMKFYWEKNKKEKMYLMGLLNIMCTILLFI